MSSSMPPNQEDRLQIPFVHIAFFPPSLPSPLGCDAASRYGVPSAQNYFGFSP